MDSDQQSKRAVIILFLLCVALSLNGLLRELISAERLTASEVVALIWGDLALALGYLGMFVTWKYPRATKPAGHLVGILLMLIGCVSFHHYVSVNRHAVLDAQSSSDAISPIWGELAFVFAILGIYLCEATSRPTRPAVRLVGVVLATIGISTWFFLTIFLGRPSFSWFEMLVIGLVVVLLFSRHLPWIMYWMGRSLSIFRMHRRPQA